MNIDQAITKFNSLRTNQFSTADVDTIKQISTELGLTEFHVIPSGDYFRDINNVVHVNAGFVVSKTHSQFMEADDVYASMGFNWRKWLSGVARSSSTDSTAKNIRESCPLCAGQEFDNHRLEECPKYHDIQSKKI